MKKTASLLLALIMLISVFSSSLVSKAENASSIAQRLAKLQTQSGFIPGGTAAVTGNCYGFISAVCEKLYGVEYQEGLSSNGYTCAHSKGLYYEVARLTTGSNVSANSSDLKNLIQFIKNNAMAGDVIHYASLSNSSSRHTIMVQSIDDEKIKVYHSNWNSKYTCQTDIIYWSKLLAADSDGSRNVIFTSKMSYSGLGISINRRVGTEQEAMEPTAALETAVTSAQQVERDDAPENLEISMVNPYSVMVEWDENENAESYILKYKKKGGKWSTIKAIEDSSYRVRKLTPGKKYYFKVCGVNDNSERSNYSKTQSVKLLPPVPEILGAKKVKKGIKISFGRVDYCSGYAVFRSNKKDGNYKKIAVIQNPDAESYTDTTVIKNKTYYYKVWCYVVVGNKVYRSEKSEAVKKRFS